MSQVKIIVKSVAAMAAMAAMVPTALMGTVSTIGPGISIKYSNVKQCLVLWLPNLLDTQLGDQSVSTSKSVAKTGSLTTGT